MERFTIVRAERPTRVALLFQTFGPYHIARLAGAVGEGVNAIGIQLQAKSREYAWDACQANDIVTLFSASNTLSKKAVRRAVFQALSKIDPDVAAIPGWSGVFSLSALRWCAARRRPAILMSESQEFDEKRSGLKEWMKSQILSTYSSALVGGTRHFEYLVKLGVPAGRVSKGYDVVDNQYFAAEAERVRRNALDLRKSHGLPEHYFLASARFIKKKNLPGLLEAYRLYRDLFAKRWAAGLGDSAGPWHLVLIGDGPLRSSLMGLRSALGLVDSVYLPGFKQYHALPTYYGLANCFIHASTTEQWGLVVNEALASGLPVLVSNRCGCVPELVQEGRNGFTFDPQNLSEIAELMLRLSCGEVNVASMSQSSQELIANWSPSTFGRGLKLAVMNALSSQPPDRSLGNSTMIALAEAQTGV